MHQIFVVMGVGKTITMDSSLYKYIFMIRIQIMGLDQCLKLKSQFLTIEAEHLVRLNLRPESRVRLVPKTQSHGSASISHYYLVHLYCIIRVTCESIITEACRFLYPSCCESE